VVERKVSDVKTAEGLRSDGGILKSYWCAVVVIAIGFPDICRGVLGLGMIIDDRGRRGESVRCQDQFVNQECATKRAYRRLRTVHQNRPGICHSVSSGWKFPRRSFPQFVQSLKRNCKSARLRLLNFLAYLEQRDG
jgi:hypothetical protein